MIRLRDLLNLARTWNQEGQDGGSGTIWGLRIRGRHVWLYGMLDCHRVMRPINAP